MNEQQTTDTTGIHFEPSWTDVARGLVIETAIWDAFDLFAYEAGKRGVS